MHKEILDGPTLIVATTFRDFKGTDNDNIQLLFLEGLKRQTYKKWVMALTLFGEKNVVPTLQREGIPYVARDGDPRGHRYSNTEVWVSGIELGKQYPKHIIVWTTCDVILDDHFFEEIVAQTKESTCGTSYPHIAYSTIEDAHAKKHGRYFWEGGDLFFFSSDVFQNPEVLEMLQTYRNDGWGATEFYLQALGIVFCKNRINIWPTKLAKVENDRVLTNETRSFLTATNDRNAEILRAFIKAHGVAGPMRLWITKFRLPYPFSPMRFRIWFEAHFRIHLLGIRYHVRRLLRLN